MFRVFAVFLLVSNALVLLADKTYYDLADAENHFAEFILKYGKVYETKDHFMERLEIFKSNLLRINDLNKVHEATFGINKYADLTREEFEKTRLGFYPPVETNTAEKITVKQEWIANAPDSLDYRDEGLVTEVKDQKQCGSCYIFSAIGNIEGQYAKKHGELISLSEQQALDCDKDDNGCHGGLMLPVMHALIKQGGSVSEEDYPYKAAVGTCSKDLSKVKVNITSASEIDTSTEEKLKGALANYGPLAIAIVMPEWQYYQGGVLTPNANCDNPVNHGVVLVGYGKVPGGRDYWIIKNSWGADWGEDGYFRLERGRQYCRIGKNYTATAEVE